MSEKFQRPGSERRAMIAGRLLQGEEFDEYCERNGMCPMCGTIKVKERKATMFGRLGTMTDIPISCTENGEIEVYKGYHISPTCYSLPQAKEELGEDTDSGIQKSRRRKKQNSSGRRLEKTDRSHKNYKRSSGLLDPQSESGLRSDMILDADVKPAPLPMPANDDLTQTSGGSSSQEQQASIGSGTAGTAESYGRMLDHPPSPGSHHFNQRNTETSDASATLRHSTGHVKTASSDNLANGRRHASDPPSSNRNFAFLENDANRHSSQKSALSSSEETPDAIALREVEDEADRLDIYQFLVQLGCHRTKPEVVKRGLQLMRDIVFKIHQSHPDKRYVFPNDNWCKTIKSAMSEHESDGSIQNEGAMTMTFVCSVSTKYKADLIMNNNSRELVTAMQTHPSAEESCCVALECLSRPHDSNTRWREEHAETVFEGLKTVLSDPSHAGSRYGILALYNLTCQENFRAEYVEDHMRVFVADSGIIETFSAVLQDDSASEEVVKAVLSLMRQYWVRFKNDSDPESTVASPDALLGGLLGAMYSYTSESSHEEICGLLAVIEIPKSTEISWKQTLSDAVLSSMTAHSMVESVQIAGLSALCNIYGDSSRREEVVADLDRVIETVIFAMNNFVRNAHLQAQGCLALACICSGGDWYKETVVTKGGIEVVSNAFRSHVINVAPETTPAMVEEVKVAASSALASLALSRAAVSDLQKSSLLMDFQTMIRRDGLSPEQPCVQTCVIDLISASLVDAGDASASGQGSSDADPEYNFLVELIVQLLSQSPIEEDAQALLASLNALSSRSSSALDVILSAEGGKGTSRIVDLLEQYPGNAGIQEAGCALLANIYFHVPFEGELDQSSLRSVGSNSTHVKTHSDKEVAVMTSALHNHKANARVVKNACEALCNFVCGLNVVASDPDDVHIPDEVAVLFSGIPKEADNAMAIHEANPETMKSVLRLLLVAVRLLKDDEMQRCSGNLIARIFETMIRFPHDEEIHEHANSIVGRFVSLKNESIDASAGNAEGLRALLLSLQMESEIAVSRAIGIISSLLQRVFSLSNDVIEIEEYFDCLIGCMHRFQDHVIIQAETCSILASLATLNEPFVKTIIVNAGAITALIFAMQTHRGQAYVLEYAAKALGAIAEGIPDEILLSVRENICGELLKALDEYANMEGVCCATLEAICEFCKRDEYFESQVVEANAAPSIVYVMAQHLPSEDVQKAGCKSLWLVASRNDENKCVLGAAGAVHALVSAMLAHVGSTAIQKEALTALKHVARVSANKESLERNETTDVVRLAMYANLGEPQVVSAALSALNDIAVDTSTREVNTVTDETMNCVLQGMQNHPLDLEVQKIACWLLRSYSFNRSNLTLMRSSREELLQLLVTASSSFPEECGERAQSILEKL